MKNLTKNLLVVVALFIGATALAVSCTKPAGNEEAQEQSDHPSDSTEHPSDSTGTEHPEHPADSTK